MNELKYLAKETIKKYALDKYLCLATQFNEFRQNEIVAHCSSQIIFLPAKKESVQFRKMEMRMMNISECK